MSPDADPAGSSDAAPPPPRCCPLYHEAVELIGRRWTGAILVVLLDHGPLRFSTIAHAVPQLSDRLLSERMKELEARGVVRRHADPGPPVRVTYELTAMGRELQPVLAHLKAWAQHWLGGGASQASHPSLGRSVERAPTGRPSDLR